jgi:hypothetical protein
VSVSSASTTREARKSVCWCFRFVLTLRWRRFLVKGRTNVGAEFSSERGNLVNKNSFKYSGLVSGKSLGVELSGEWSDTVCVHVHVCSG